MMIICHQMMILYYRFFINRKLSSFLDLLKEPYRYPGSTSRNASKIRPVDHRRDTGWFYLQKL